MQRLLLAWLATWTLAARAASLTADVRGFDFTSLGMAAMAGLAGGVFRTIYTLAGNRWIVFDAPREALKDLLIAAGGGIVAYGIMEVITAQRLMTVPSETRMWVLFFTGASGGQWRSVIDKFGGDAVERARLFIRGGSPLPPASAPAPLDTNPPPKDKP